MTEADRDYSEDFREIRGGIDSSDIQQGENFHSESDEEKAIKKVLDENDISYREISGLLSSGECCLDCIHFDNISLESMQSGYVVCAVLKAAIHKDDFCIIRCGHYKKKEIEE